MTGVPVPERSEELPAEPVSARRARRVVLDALSDWSLGALCDEAALLVSEVVTNSLLHAGSPMGLTVRRLGSGVRVEVRDRSTSMPSPRHYPGDSVTGRGLEILDLTASNWGAELFEDGKVVWFELGTEAPTDGHADGVGDGADGVGFTVRLIRTPVKLAKATFDYGDAMLRELALLSFSDGGGLPAMPRVVTPDLDLTEMMETLEIAALEDRRHVDMELELPARSATAALERLALVDEADRMAQEGRLLLPPALPEIAHCRRWMMGEIVGQASGEAPTAWSYPQESDDPLPAEGISEADESLLGDELEWTFVADQDNRIQFAGAEAAAFLGWSPEALAGRRVTTLVPPDLREAHLVGFTRYQLTRAAVLMGRPVAVDAMRRDGSTVAVTLLLREMPARDGRLRYRAFLSPAK
ncbi:MAG TPA: PAS domain S-box protein [Acidimicrobiales bacterium]|nr:PAS domain S-box protein [Acidimicrobiales bacterium]